MKHSPDLVDKSPELVYTFTNGETMGKKKEEWLTTAQVAEIMGCGIDNVQYLVNHGRLQGKKILDRWVILQSSVEAYLAHPPKRGPKPKKDNAK